MTKKTDSPLELPEYVQRADTSIMTPHEMKLRDFYLHNCKVINGVFSATEYEVICYRDTRKLIQGITNTAYAAYNFL